MRAYPRQARRERRVRAQRSREVAPHEGWQIEELHTEEGRLDEVFRSITLPDTSKEARTQ